MFPTIKLALCIAMALAFTSGIAVWEPLSLENDGLPYVDASGTLQCCIKPPAQIPTPTSDRTPYLDKDGDVKCCIKRSEIAHLMGGNTDGGMPYEDANGNLKCCIKPMNAGGKSPSFLPSLMLQ